MTIKQVVLSILFISLWCTNGLAIANHSTPSLSISDSTSQTNDIDAPVDFLHFLPKDAQYVNWIFSGVVSNEKGDQYGYFFQMQHTGNVLKSTAALFDAQTKQVIFQDENQTEYDNHTPYHWEVGRSFLSFNPINASWVFGVKTKDKNGFNFKIDMLAQSNAQSLEEKLRPGVSVTISQTNSLNGHIRAGGHEEFVTAKHAWFRQVAMNTIDDVPHVVSGLLCHFDDNSGFYSMKLPESDALHGSMAGRFDTKGVPAEMSQFIHVKQLPEGPWDIHIPSPNYHLLLSEYIKQNGMIAGFVMHDSSLGFCLLSDETISKV